VPGTYRVEFIPPEAAGLEARAFTTIELITDTVLDVEFCLCSGVWVTETVDSTGNVGGSTSLALVPVYPYTPHISYHDATSDNVKHAWLSKDHWLSETVDSAGGGTSLALVPTDPYTPCISYDDWWGRWELFYAYRDEEAWDIEKIASQRASHSSLALEPAYPYAPHISFYYPWATIQTLYHVYLSATTWMSGTWIREWVEPHLSRVGGNGSLALETTHPYTPHISYRHNVSDDLKYAWKSGTVWLSQTVDSVGRVGLFTSLALNSGGNPRISYFDDTNSALKYAWLSGSTWLSETVDSVGKMPYNRGRSSLELGRGDVPCISYYDATSGDLKMARRAGTVWIIQTVDSGGDVGQYSSLALDAVGCPHISYYDATHGDLRYARIPAVYYVYLPITMRDYP
jgi:hypothetical protein